MENSGLCTNGSVKMAVAKTISPPKVLTDHSRLENKYLVMEIPVGKIELP